MSGETSQSETQACWVCGSHDTTLFRPATIPQDLSPEDLRITDSHYGATVRLYRCRRCGFLFGDNEQVKAVALLYGELEDPDYEAGAGVRCMQMRSLLTTALAVQPSARTLLDIGAGIGLLLKEAAELGLEAEGVEPSKWAVARGKGRYRVVLHRGTFPHEATRGRCFDIIMLIDVIEHVNDPVKLLGDIKEHLAPKGVCVIVTPDVSSLAARILGHRWWHYRPAHIGYFNDHSMTRALSRAGLRVIQRHRAKWYFTVAYLANRVAVYLPWVAAFKRLFRPLRLDGLTVPLNLFDSWCYVVRSNE